MNEQLFEDDGKRDIIVKKLKMAAEMKAEARQKVTKVQIFRLMAIADSLTSMTGYVLDHILLLLFKGEPNVTQKYYTTISKL